MRESSSSQVRDIATQTGTQSAGGTHRPDLSDPSIKLVFEQIKGNKSACPDILPPASELLFAMAEKSEGKPAAGKPAAGAEKEKVNEKEDDEQKKVSAMVANLGDNAFIVREKASKDLKAYIERDPIAALPRVEKGLKGNAGDLEIVRRLDHILRPTAESLKDGAVEPVIKALGGTQSSGFTIDSIKQIANARNAPAEQTAQRLQALTALENLIGEVRGGIDYAEVLPAVKQQIAELKDRKAIDKQLAELTSVTLMNGSITDNPLKQLLPQMKGLETLVLNFSNISNASLEAIKDNRNIRDLRLVSTKVTNDGLANLKSFDKLEKLYLNGTSVSDAGLQNLSGLKNLKELDLQRTGVTGDGLSNLKNTNLEVLRLGFNKLDDKGMKHIGSLSNLKELNLTQTNISDTGLAQVSSLKGLTKLDFSHTKVTEAGLKNLQGLSNLESLDLDWMSITNEGLKSLGKLTNLKELTIRGGGITDEGLKQLEGLHNLRSLKLHYTSVTQDGAIHLKEMLPQADITTVPDVNSR
jgi:Leucine-rich repeat (LRR) protein